MNIIVRLGGFTNDDQYRWSFCYLLVPQDEILTLQNNKLIIRAQTEQAQQGTKLISTNSSTMLDTLSLRAYQSGQTIYRSFVLGEEPLNVHKEHETALRSAIAIPVGGADDLSIGVLCIVSNEVDAFPEDARQVLEIMSKIVGNILLTYRVHQKMTEGLTKRIVHSGVDLSNNNFLLESDFMSDVEALLANIHSQVMAEYLSGAVSFIALGIDNLSSLTIKYGNYLVRNLSKAVGLRLLNHLSSTSKSIEQQIYYTNIGEFYLLLDDTSLEKAKFKAEKLRQALSGSYSVLISPTPSNISTLSENMIELTNVTVRLGVISHSYVHLKEIFQQQNAKTAVASITAQIAYRLEATLVEGLNTGGNTVVSWDTTSR